MPIRSAVAGRIQGGDKIELTFTENNEFPDPSITFISHQGLTAEAEWTQVATCTIQGGLNWGTPNCQPVGTTLGAGTLVITPQSSCDGHSSACSKFVESGDLVTFTIASGYRSSVGDVGSVSVRTYHQPVLSTPLPSPPPRRRPIIPSCIMLSLFSASTNGTLC